MEDIFSIIQTAPEPQQQFLQQLFQSIPISSRSCRIVKMKAEVKFITANSPCDEIWILIDGTVKGMEEHISGDVYTFSQFHAPELFGEMEALSGMATYKATIVTSTDCRFVVFPLEKYLNWIRHDAESLFLRTRMLMKNFLEQTKKERTFLFLSGLDRLMVFLTKYYRKYAKDNFCTIKMNRQQIADELGYSTKTVNRSIKKLLEKEAISKSGGKITISKQQYDRLVKEMDKKLTQ